MQNREDANHRQLIEAKKAEFARLEAKLERVVADYSNADLNVIGNEVEQVIATEESKNDERNK